jgi:hypothetical protein
VVPGSFGEQSADVGVAGLGDRSWTLLAPEEYSLGATSMNEPMVLPMPVTELDCQRESGQRTDAPEAAQARH